MKKNLELIIQFKVKIKRIKNEFRTKKFLDLVNLLKSEKYSDFLNLLTEKEKKNGLKKKLNLLGILCGIMEFQKKNILMKKLKFTFMKALG